MRPMDVFSIQMDGDVVVEGEDGQRGFGLRFCVKPYRAQIADGAVLFQPFAEVVVGDDGRLFLEEFVRLGVVHVVMGVDEK